MCTHMYIIVCIYRCCNVYSFMEFTRFYFLFFYGGPNPELLPNPPFHGLENKGREIKTLAQS